MRTGAPSDSQFLDRVSPSESWDGWIQNNVRVPSLTPPDYESREAFGPFHRKASPTQTRSDLEKQLASGELWGKPRRHGLFPAVKAHAGALPTGEQGVEFWTFQPPSDPWGPRLFWREAGQCVVIDTSKQIARLEIAISKGSQ